MPIITAKSFAILLLGLGFGGLLLVPVIVLMHFLMPIAVLDRYWKPPHFRPTELALLTRTVFAPMRTVMFLWIFLFPGAGKKRQVTDIYQLVPRWYRVAAIAIDIWILATATGILALAVGFDLYWRLAGQV
jgi:hypothetical protein